MSNFEKTMHGYSLDEAETSLRYTKPNGFFGERLFMQVFDDARFFQSNNQKVSTEYQSHIAELETEIESRDDSIEELQEKLQESTKIADERLGLLKDLYVSGETLDGQIDEITIDGMEAPWSKALQEFQDALYAAKTEIPKETDDPPQPFCSAP